MTEDKKRTMPIMCCVPNCSNDPWEGEGSFIIIGGARMWICAPCLEFLLEGRGEESALFYNAMDRMKVKLPDKDCNVDPTTNEA